MTQEEAIKVLEQLRQWTDYPKEALTMAIEALSKPSLPSNLDEAAEEYSLDVKAKPYGNIVKEAFKDGATWRDSQIPELPSNLDEAAKEYLRQYNESESGNGGDDWDDDICITFKTGAVWMAGQFQKIDGCLTDWYETNGVDYCHGIRANESFEVPEGFYIKKK